MLLLRHASLLCDIVHRAITICSNSQVALKSIYTGIEAGIRDHNSSTAVVIWYPTTMGYSTQTHRQTVGNKIADELASQAVTQSNDKPEPAVGFSMTTRKPSCRWQTHATRKHAKNCSNSTCLQRCLWQYRSIFIRLAVQCCCVQNLRNPEKFSENSNLQSSRSSKVTDLGVNWKCICNLLFWMYSGLWSGRISYSFWDIDTFSYKIASIRFVFDSNANGWFTGPYIHPVFIWTYLHLFISLRNLHLSVASALHHLACTTLLNSGLDCRLRAHRFRG